MTILTDKNELIMQKAKELEQETIRTRAYLYENPEVSSKEFETSKFLKEEVRKLGLEIEEIAGTTGFTALLDTGKPGKILGIRADIDALPVQENPNNLAGPRKYYSKNPGVMHACGHDGHMAIALSTMKIVHDLRDSLIGKIYFIFEEGEEIGSGIEATIKHLQNRGIEAIYGNHLTAFMDSGTVSVEPGPRMAGAVLVDFSVYGRSGHGARPDLSVNPLFGAANVLTGLTNAWANQVDVTKTVTLGLTEIHGGTAKNVIPEKVDIGGTLRFYDMKEGEKASEIIKKVAEHTAQAHNCTVEFSEDYGVAAKPVINDEKLAELAEKGVEEVLPGAAIRGLTWFASEPFNQYANIAPTLFAFIGARNTTYGSGAEHHNDKFDIDENALINGVIVTAKFTVDFLTE